MQLLIKQIENNTTQVESIINLINSELLILKLKSEYTVRSFISTFTKLKKFRYISILIVFLIKQYCYTKHLSYLSLFTKFLMMVFYFV